jgi:hypothetical protein
MDDDFDELMVEARELGKASRHGRIAGTPEMFGSAAFFASATETLVLSTKERREIGGACYYVHKGDAVILVGLERLSRGRATHVAIDPSWGSVLWHTHPGKSFSLAAFSEEDIQGARQARRPLLVIGYKSASPDVLGVTMAAGMLGGDGDELNERLLRIGVAAQVCWPNGEIRPVLRYQRSGLREAVDQASFQVDRALGAAARVINPTSLRAWSKKLKDTLEGRSRKT